MYAVIQTGGKQYRVAEGDTIRVEKLTGDVGSKVEFTDILMVGGEKVEVGKPHVGGAKVTAEIIAQDDHDIWAVIRDGTMLYDERDQAEDAGKLHGAPMNSMCFGEGGWSG